MTLHAHGLSPRTGIVDYSALHNKPKSTCTGFSESFLFTNKLICMLLAEKECNIVMTASSQDPLTCVSCVEGVELEILHIAWHCCMPEHIKAEEVCLLATR